MRTRQKKKCNIAAWKNNVAEGGVAGEGRFPQQGGTFKMDLKNE